MNIAKAGADAHRVGGAMGVGKNPTRGPGADYLRDEPLHNRVGFRAGGHVEGISSPPASAVKTG